VRGAGNGVFRKRKKERKKRWHRHQKLLFLFQPP
jgi:hypothetical protein